MDRYAIYIRSEGIMVKLLCDPAGSVKLRTLQELVEGYIETVPTVLADDWSKEPDVGTVLIVNEEGKLRGLPLNQWATDLSGVYDDVIVGNAVLMGTRGEELIGLTKAAADNIVKNWGSRD